MTTSLVRRLGLDSNPLRRATDRLEAWLRIGLVLAFLVGGSLTAWGAGRWTHAGATATSAARAASERQVTAILLQDAPTTTYPYRGNPGLGSATARWTAPNGATQTGQVRVPAGSRAGSTTRIWVDRAGRLAPAPLRPSEVKARVMTVVLLVAAGFALLLVALLAVLARVLERRRLAAWEQAWSAVEPRWTRRLR